VETLVLMGAAMNRNGLAIAATGGAAIVIWRAAESGQVVDRRLSGDGTPLDPTPILLDEGTQQWPQGEPHRILDVGVDGQSFWVTWSIWGRYEGGFAGAQSTASAGCINRAYSREPVWLQQVSASMTPLPTSPLELDRESRPSALGSYFVDGARIVLAQEREDRSKIDSYAWRPALSAAPLAIPVDRFESGDGNDSPCGYAWLGNPRVRSLSEGGLLTATLGSSQYVGFVVERRGFVVNQLSSTGELHAWATHFGGHPDLFAATAQVDLAANSGFTATAYDGIGSTPAQAAFPRVSLLLRAGGPFGDSLVVATDSLRKSGAATVAATGTGFLLAWIDRREDGFRIVSQHVDPSAPLQ